MPEYIEGEALRCRFSCLLQPVQVTFISSRLGIKLVAG